MPLPKHLYTHCGKDVCVNVDRTPALVLHVLAAEVCHLCVCLQAMPAYLDTCRTRLDGKDGVGEWAQVFAQLLDDSSERHRSAKRSDRNVEASEAWAASFIASQDICQLQQTESGTALLDGAGRVLQGHALRLMSLRCAAS